jgi:iron complex outermembrane receptor protein
VLKSLMFKSGLVVFACSITIGAYAMADAPKQVDIPAGDLANALEMISEQAGVELVFNPAQLKGLHTKGVTGKLSTRDAVKKLIEGTPLQLRTDEATGAMMIGTPPPAAPPKPSSIEKTPLRAQDEGTGTVHLAQTSQGAPGSDSSVEKQKENEPASQKSPVILEEIVVTGSHIRGAEAAGSKVIVIDKDDIEKSGYARISDILSTVTQNFQGVGETSFNQAGANNLNYGSEVQLRGLGPGTTLTLVNGQRQASAGLVGQFVDISSIPASAIERIEILADGASALYGSDAIGGAVNVILRKDFDGFETRVRGSTAAGDVANGLQLGQLWGHTWSTGHVLVGYQYDRRDSLPASSRSISAANNNFASFGGTDYQTSYGSNPGEILDPVTYQPVAAIPKGQNGTNLTAGQLLPGVVRYADFVTNQDILPRQETHSAFFSASQTLVDGWELALDARYTTRGVRAMAPNEQEDVVVPTTNAFNRMNAPVVVAYDFTDDLGPGSNYGTTDTFTASPSITGALPRGWQLTLSGNYSHELDAIHTDFGVNSSALTAALADSNPATALNVFGDGSNTNPATLALLRTTNFAHSTSTTSSADAIADGPLFEAPAGPAKLAVGADYRIETESTDGSSLYVTEPSRVSRDVSAVFSEFSVPLLGRDSAVGSLDLSAAGRYDHYSDVGDTFNPKMGLTWRPTRDVGLRGTWGTSFRAPPFSDTAAYSLPTAGAIPVRDPLSAAGFTRALVEFGSGPPLSPEKAHVWTTGIDITPTALKGLSLAFTYWNIHYQNKISTPGTFANFLTQAEIYAPFITRAPTQAQINAACDTPNQQFVIGSCTGAFGAILDDRLQNLSSVLTSGLDADLNYSLPTPAGTWGFRLNGTYTFDYKTQLVATAPVFDVVNTFENPLKLRLAGHISWSLARYFAQTSVNYSGSYLDPNFTPDLPISSWTTVDLTLGYRIDDTHSWLNKTKVYLSATNLFNRQPPFANEYLYGYDPANASLIGRQLSLQVIKGW